MSFMFGLLGYTFDMDLMQSHPYQYYSQSLQAPSPIYYNWLSFHRKNLWKPASNHGKLISKTKRTGWFWVFSVNVWSIETQLHLPLRIFIYITCLVFSTYCCLGMIFSFYTWHFECDLLLWGMFNWCLSMLSTLILYHKDNGWKCRASINIVALSLCLWHVINHHKCIINLTHE